MNNFIKSLCISLLLAGITANAMDKGERIRLGWELERAAKKGDYDMGVRSIKAGADINKKDMYGNTPLMLTVFYDQITVTQLLLRAGANIDLPNENDTTPLIKATFGDNHIAMVRLLLEYGANVNHADHYGNTPLFGAAKNGNIAVAELLLGAGANVNHENKNRSISLIYAAEQGHDAVVELLLAAGADVNHETDNGYTPLSLASQNGHDATVQLLLKSGAHVNHANNKGNTPLTRAIAFRRETACEILVEWMLSHCPTSSQKQCFKTLLLCLQRLGIPVDIRKSVFPPLLFALADQENREFVYQEINKIYREDTKQRLLDKFFNNPSSPKGYFGLENNHE